MTIIEKLFIEQPKLPKCEALRKIKYAATWEAMHPDKTCMRHAKYKINGTNLCKRHAEIMALSILLKSTRKK